LSQMRIDEKGGRRDQQRAAIGRGARNGLSADRSTRSRTVLDNNRRALSTTDLVCKKARQEIGRTTRRVWNDDFNRSRCLTPREMVRESKKRSPQNRTPPRLEQTV